MDTNKSITCKSKAETLLILNFKPNFITIGKSKNENLILVIIRIIIIIILKIIIIVIII